MTYEDARSKGWSAKRWLDYLAFEKKLARAKEYEPARVRLFVKVYPSLYGRKRAKKS